ncbi:MAG: hypothetical protein KDJ86_06300 [Bauldia sp.]|uniref:calcium-binding protein n=1 Tax=Bauldia sp. TaxID=2575872 RepID=UPI001D28DFC9|nr:calcium-binding protein [Bauldia sp.]MCB1495376.1 hypothetical protein [Bauldia sp.]
MQKTLTLDPGAATILKQFVMNGGTLIVFQDERNTDFVNSVFGTDLSWQPSSSTSTRQGDASGTTFQDGPNAIPDNASLDAVDEASLPPGAESYYENALGDSTVFSFQVGKGQITYLGWDWEDSFPAHFVGQDGGWNKVLDNSISETDGKTNGAFIKGTKKDDKVTLTKALKGETATEFDDYIKLKKGDDKAKAGDGADMIFGAKGEDKCIGQDGNDWLAGEQDDDILKGGDGMDCFYFNKKLAKAGVDYIKDFSFSDNDLVVLSQKVFSDLSLGSMSTTDFNDHIDINSNGEIEYNGDVFARVKSGVAALMDEEDFVVVA